MRKLKYIGCIIIFSSFLISCNSKTEFQKLFDDGLYAKAFLSSLNIKTISSNSFKEDKLTRYTLIDHLKGNTEELTNIRKDNGISVKNTTLFNKDLEFITGTFSSFISSGKEECYYTMDNEYPDNKEQNHSSCDQIMKNIESYLGNRQLKIFGVHTIVDGEQFVKYKEVENKYTKYFSIHMLNRNLTNEEISELTTTFFGDETLNDVRIIGKNILQCNLRVTRNSKPDSTECDKIQILLESIE
tara:strand:+ start:365 stop:1093 length:729 start_codon:yes stop_codon:yes gene_type:complete